MPTYEYRCAEGHEFERFQRMSDEPLSTCPTCGAEAQRLLSAGAGFLFKGSGFYITDYRSDSWREAAKRDGADAVTGVSPGASPEKSDSGDCPGGGEWGVRRGEHGEGGLGEGGREGPFRQGGSKAPSPSSSD
jgi:putative FmdB family regulatory protein